jgi:predicted RNA binding protein YcfA (HicA-like mRNA interferase family)
MARSEKTLSAMRNNPRDWRIASLEAVATAAGVNVRKSGGSHVIFEHPDLAEGLSVPARRPIKPIYVQRFVRLIDIVQGGS